MPENESTKHGPQLKYMKKAVRKFYLDVNRNTDPEMLAHLEKQQNVAQYIKGLIRTDMESK